MTFDIVIPTVLVIVSLLLTGIGIEMVNSPPTKNWHKWAYRVAFLVLGTAMAVLTIIQSAHTANNQRTTEQRAAKERLEDRGDIKFMEGLLTNLVNKPGGPDLKDLAKALGAGRSQPSTPLTSATPVQNLREEGQHLANEIEQWWIDKNVEFQKMHSGTSGTTSEMFFRQFAFEWSDRFSARADAYLQKVRREQTDVHIPEELIFECKLANNLLVAEECRRGIKSASLQLR